MTLVIEDGTQGVSSPTPNSYVTTEELTTFTTDRGLFDVADSGDGEQESALLKAADYMTQKYRLVWKGSRVQAFQPMDWPRRGVDVPDFFDPFFKQTNVPISFQDTLFIPEDVVPQEVKTAQMLLAIATYSGDVSTGNLQPSLSRTTKREKLGTLEVEYMGADDGHTRVTVTYWDSKHTIEPFLLASHPFTGQMVRS